MLFALFEFWSIYDWNEGWQISSFLHAWLNDGWNYSTISSFYFCVYIFVSILGEALLGFSFSIFRSNLCSVFLSSVRFVYTST